MSLIIINGNFAGPKNLQHAKFLQKRTFLNYTVFMNITGFISTCITGNGWVYTLL